MPPLISTRRTLGTMADALVRYWRERHARHHAYSGPVRGPSHGDDARRRRLHDHSRGRRPAQRVAASILLSLGALLLAFIVLLALAILTTSAQAQGTERVRGNGRVAVVDLALLVDSAPTRPEAERKYTEQVRRGEAMVKAVADSLRLAVDDLAQLQSRLSRAEREAALHLMRAREIQFEDMIQQLELAVERERQALHEPILVSVREAMRTVREREGWGVIVDRRSLGAVVEVDAAHDVTPRVLTELRRQAAARVSQR
jgi:Skp family chaperone for outer membrane proteins